MKFQIEDITVYFPYDHIYPEQHSYMFELKRAIDAKGHCLLEMPTGTGKTIALLSFITSYALSKPPLKLIYCTRTVHEMEKTLAELKLLYDYQVRHLGPSTPLLAVGLSSRKNLCINPTVVSSAENRDFVDAGCRKLTASWVRDLSIKDASIPTCSFFENYEKDCSEAKFLRGVYTMQDLRAFGKQKGWCPYFLARHMVRFAHVVVYSYQYLLDPKVAGIISKEMQRESVVVFDEAHNIDNVCIEALSVSVRGQTLEGATRNISKMYQEIERFKATDAGKLRAEYNRLVEGLAQGEYLRNGDIWLSNPALPDDILKEAVPGNIRRAEHFLSVLRRLVQYLKSRMQTQNFEESPVSFVASLNSQVGIDQKTLRFCYDRLSSLMMTLEITDTNEYLNVQTICDFATLVGTYARGFSIIFEPFDERMPDIPDPILQLSCHDASFAIKPVFERFQSVVITSGTLSPIDLYPRLLNFNPVVSRSFTMSLTRECICPMVITRGCDQLPVSTKYDMRSDPGVARNYGRLLLEMASVVPDGIVCFFVSYSYMDAIVNTWNETGMLKDIMQCKLVFIETQDLVETTLALDNYHRACDCGRGAIFFSVARGKVAEGIDFDRHYGRLVIMFGVPFQYTLSRILLARLSYLRDTFQIKEGDFLTFDALRQAAQCVGRVIRSKADYGMMIFADKRYSRHDKRSKLPGWILSHLRDACLNLSTDMALHIAREFLRKMAQPYDKTGASGRKTLLSQEDVKQMSNGSADMPIISSCSTEPEYPLTRIKISGSQPDQDHSRDSPIAFQISLFGFVTAASRGDTTSTGVQSYTNCKEMMKSTQRSRIILKCPAKNEASKLVRLPDTVQELLEIGGKRFGCSCTKLVTANGAEVDIECI